MKTKLWSCISLSSLSTISKKAVIAICLLLLMVFSLAQFMELVKITIAPPALLTGIVLGILGELGFDLETLFVLGGITLMLVALLLMVLVALVSATWFKSIFIFVSVAIIGTAFAIAMQWLIKNWICRSFGKFYGVLISAIAISLGIILQQ